MELDVANVWSRYSAIHDFLQQPIHSVVNIVGGPPKVQQEIKDLILKAVQANVVKPNQPKNYAEPCYRIQAYDLPSECPRPPKAYDKMESGYIRTQFFSNLGYDKPAVTIFVFDLRDYFSSGQNWDWQQIEREALFQIKKHTDMWQADLSVPSKYTVIFLLPDD